MKLSLNIDGIIGAFGEGSASELARRLSDYGFSITKQGVSRWRSTDGLPMRAWLAICEIELNQKGTIPDLRKFLRRVKT
jgi:hypothetical protein